MNYKFIFVVFLWILQLELKLCFIVIFWFLGYIRIKLSAFLKFGALFKKDQRSQFYYISILVAISRNRLMQIHLNLHDVQDQIKVKQDFGVPARLPSDSKNFCWHVTQVLIHLEFVDSAVVSNKGELSIEATVNRGTESSFRCYEILRADCSKLAWSCQIVFQCAQLLNSAISSALK